MPPVLVVNTNTLIKSSYKSTQGASEVEATTRPVGLLPGLSIFGIKNKKLGDSPPWSDPSSVTREGEPQKVDAEINGYKFND